MRRISLSRRLSRCFCNSAGCERLGSLPEALFIRRVWARCCFSDSVSLTPSLRFMISPINNLVCPRVRRGVPIIWSALELGPFDTAGSPNSS